jgi:hypothetical protein
MGVQVPPRAQMSHLGTKEGPEPLVQGLLRCWGWQSGVGSMSIRPGIPTWFVPDRQPLEMPPFVVPGAGWDRMWHLGEARAHGGGRAGVDGAVRGVRGGVGAGPRGHTGIEREELTSTTPTKMIPAVAIRPIPLMARVRRVGNRPIRNHREVIRAATRRIAPAIASPDVSCDSNIHLPRKVEQVLFFHATSSEELYDWVGQSCGQ